MLGAARSPPDGEDVTDWVVVSCEVGLFLKMTCAIKDVVAPAAIVHNNLMTKGNGGKVNNGLNDLAKSADIEAKLSMQEAV